MSIHTLYRGAIRRAFLLLSLTALATNLSAHWVDYYINRVWWYDPETGDSYNYRDANNLYYAYFHYAEREAELLHLDEDTYGVVVHRAYGSEYTAPITIILENRTPDSAPYFQMVEYTPVKLGESLFRYQPWVTKVTLPRTIRELGKYVFSGCTELTEVNFLPQSPVTYIPSDAFSGCSKLSTFIWPDSLLEIGASAFSGTPFTSAQLEIPATVKAIDQKAFSNCQNLTYLNIHAGVTFLGPRIAQFCDQFENFNVDPDNENYCSVDGVLFNKAQTHILEYPFGRKGTYTIPDNVTEITPQLFFNYYNLTGITIGEGIHKIEEEAFRGCQNMESVTFSSHIDTIGRGAFDGCSSLTSLTLPQSLTTIEKTAFFKCSGLISVTFPQSLTTIGQGAFMSCIGLSSMTMGSNVKKIESGAFNNCPNISSITCYATTPPTLGFMTFDGQGGGFFGDGIMKTCTLYVPKSAVEAYRAAEGWGDFENIVGLESIEVDHTIVTKEPRVMPNLKYEGFPQQLILLGNASTGTMKYKLGTDGEWITEEPRAENAGVYEVYYKVVDGTDLTPIYGPIICNMAKAKPIFDHYPYAKSNLVYTGEPQTIINAPDMEPGTWSKTHGKLLYSRDNIHWSEALPQATEIGNYHVYYRLEGDSNHLNLSGYLPLVGTIGNGTVKPIPLHENYPAASITVLAAQQGPNTPEKEEAGNLLDGDKDTKWCSLDNGYSSYPKRQRDVVVWKTAEPVNMASYTLTTGNDTKENPNRNWRNWTIYGGNFANDSLAADALLKEDGWTIIDNQIDDLVLESENRTDYQFACNNPGTYQYYRLVIHQIKWVEDTYQHSVQQMAELTMGIAADPRELTAEEDPNNTGNYYTTFYHSTQRFALPNDGTEAYVAHNQEEGAYENELTLTKIAEGSEVLPENVAVILKSPSNPIILTPTDDPGVTFEAVNDLMGVDKETAVADLGFPTGMKLYLFGVTIENGAGFYQLEADSLEANKAFAGYTHSTLNPIPFVFHSDDPGPATPIVNTDDDRPSDDRKLLKDGQLLIIHNGKTYTAQGQEVK